VPTEHEFKYVISLDLVDEFTKSQIKEMCVDYRCIEQGVICHGPGMYLRIRKCSFKDKNKASWQMTFKLKDADRTIEIETPIDSRDGEDLWTRCYWSLTKDRYVCEKYGIRWEIDFFKHKNDVYFILAEAELPEDAPKPEKLPGFLKKHLIYEVPLTDDRFSNKRLGSVSYAKKIYKQLLKERIEYSK
jgi:CYTH domain-containing protein